MLLSISKKSGRWWIGAAIVAICIHSPAPADAQNAAEAIAGKFAADETPSQPIDDKDQQWLHEEARRAVERALAKDGENNRPAPPAVDEKSIDAPRSPSELAAERSEPAAKVEPSASEESAGREERAESQKPAPREERDAPAVSGDENAEVPVEDGNMLEAESRELADKLREVRRKREADGAGASAPGDANHGPQPTLIERTVSGLATKAAGYISPLVEKRVSILIEMDVGKRGVRNWSKTADPMLCIHQSCYLSRGPNEAAEKLTRSVAFGPGVALGKRGQACRSSPKCIFRDIDLETVEAKLQPVDLRFLRHDRRETKAIRADATCAIFEGHLSCAAPVSGEGWRAWIVPESVAEEAGISGLEAALKKGL